MAKEIVRAPSDLSVWQQNMNVLSQRQPKLAKVLSDYMARHGHELEHYETTTPAGRWVQGLTPAPFFEPSSEPKFTWSKKSRETPIFFQYGAGTPPYLLKSIMALPKEALSMIVVEPNIALLAYVMHITQVYMPVPRGTSLVFVTVPDEESIFKEQDEELRQHLLWSATNDLMTEALMAGLNFYGLFSIIYALTSSHPGEEEAMKGSFTKIAKAVSEWSTVRITQLGNSAEDTMIGMRQMALMAPWISYGYQFESLIDKFAGHPFIVVSAGPSLDKNYELLRDIQDKCVILATDAVLGKLIKSGIMPHVVCCLERGLVTYDVYFAENLDLYKKECSEILLISQSVCTPKIFGRWPGPKIVIGKEELPVDRWFVSETMGGKCISSGASVAHTCYCIALTLKASSVALIGQDLAYAEDGFMHAEGVYNENRRSSMRRTGDAGLKRVEGALGGTVLTSNVFLMFLRMFEEMIMGTSVPTYDCTEGGALIRGTRIEPFAEYIAREAEGLAPLEYTPIDVVRAAGIRGDRKSWHETLKTKLKNSSDGLNHIDRMMGEIKDLMAKVCAPGLDPKRRVRYAVMTSQLLDSIHKRNEALSFITQSYVYLATTEITRVRFLDSVETIERWKEVHQEIMDAHGSVLSFMKRWLKYAEMALDYYADRELPMTPLQSDQNIEKVSRLILGDPSDGLDDSAFQLEMDNILGSADIARLKWPGKLLWQCALFLSGEGRSEEAGVLMKAAADEFEDKEMAVDEMIAFFKDYARVLSMRDLCHSPDYEYADAILDNAVSLGGADREIIEIRRQILRGNLAHYLNAVRLITDSGEAKHRAKLIVAKGHANEAILDGDAFKAMRFIWDAVREVGPYIPQHAARQLFWLTEHMDSFFDASKGKYAPEIEKIVAEMASRREVLLAVPMRYSKNLLDALARHGLSITVEAAPADEKEKIEAAAR